MLEHGERRQFIRMQTECKMTCRLAQSDETFTATCHNLSGAGVFFSTDRAIEPGRALEIKICPANKVTPPLEALVEVLRVEEKEDGYEVAAEIKGIKS